MLGFGPISALPISALSSAAIAGATVTFGATAGPATIAASLNSQPPAPATVTYGAGSGPATIALVVTTAPPGGVNVTFAATAGPASFSSTFFAAPSSGPITGRDWDILEAVRDALIATQQFDGVHLAAAPEQHGTSAGETAVAWVEKSGWDEIDESDDPSVVQDTRRVEFTLTIAVRNEDSEIRDRELDRLEHVAANAIDGQSLFFGLSIPGWTKLLRGRWQKAMAPERRTVIHGVAPYWVEGDSGHDTSP